MLKNVYILTGFAFNILMVLLFSLCSYYLFSHGPKHNYSTIQDSLAFVFIVGTICGNVIYNLLAYTNYILCERWHWDDVPIPNKNQYTYNPVLMALYSNIKVYRYRKNKDKKEAEKIQRKKDHDESIIFNEFLKRL